MKEYVCMMFCDETKPLYLEIDAFEVSLGAGLLKIKGQDEVSDNTWLHLPGRAYEVLKEDTAILREALRILHGLENFHHYSFAREVSIITDHKPLAAIFKKDVATLSQRFQWILLRIH